jgi:hypothetical protein
VKLSVGDVLELVGLALVVLVVWLATGLAWATCIPAAAGLLYLAHAWDWDGIGGATGAVAPAKPAEPIVTNRYTA